MATRENGKRELISKNKEKDIDNNNKTKNKNKTRRGYGKKNKKHDIEKGYELSIVGTNSAGLTSKKESLYNIINILKPSIITIQETKHTKIGNTKIPGYQNFERLRKGRSGGGLLTSVIEDLDPVLIATANDDIELMTVEVNVGMEKIRIINGYGPQEHDDINSILSFWMELEAEVIKAKDDNRNILIQMDANAKLGSEIVKGDPHRMSNNGKLLFDLLERQDLVVVNALNKCKGIITRERTLENKSEKSVIDYIVISQGLQKFLIEMNIDEDKKYALARYVKNKKGTKVVNSDHNTLFCKFSVSFNKKPNIVRKEFFKFKCEEGRKKFLDATSSNNLFTSCFSNLKSFETCSNKFYRTLTRTFHKCFKKIRIKNGNNKKIGNASTQEKLKSITELKSFLKECKCKVARRIAETKIKETEEAIAIELSEKNTETVKEYLENMETLEGNFSQTSFWKLKQKLHPIASDPPMAKHDPDGNLITSHTALKKLYLSTYKNRLRHREMKNEYLDIYFLKSELWRSRLENMRKIKTAPWNMKQLEAVLKSLKSNKSMDPNGMVNEVFKSGYIGTDLKEALLLFFNEVKSSHFIPHYMTLENITTIYKSKGSRLDMNSDRGIFLLTVMKKIIDKLIYNDSYTDIDRNMSDSNIGSRKRRNAKDHLFIIHGVINSVIKGKEDPVDIQIYDLEKAFDALWLEDCLNDLYDSTSQHNHNDKMSLLYEANKVNMVAVKTAVGMTDRENIPTIVQQGGTWGPILCSNSLDGVGKKCRDMGKHCYLYKNTARILPLAFVDDLNGISKCGNASLSLNGFINTQIELKKLRFHTADSKGKSKCHKLHIGREMRSCPVLHVHGTQMEEVKDDKYLGDVLSSDGKNTKNIKDRISKGVGIINNILNLLDLVNFGQFAFEVAVLLRNSMLINGVMTNAEVWYNFSKIEIQEFENLDKLFFGKLLGVPKSTPSEAYYLELGVIPITAILKGRRVNYLHNILTREPDSMLYTFFITQWLNPTRGDWVLQVREDMKDLEIPCSFDYIRSKTKIAFKNLVKSKVKRYALEILKMKQMKHSKMTNITYKSLKMQNYFTRPDVEHQDKKTIFRYRVRMERFGENFRGGAESIQCPLCFSHLDNQEMSFNCPKIKQEIDIQGNISDIYEDDIPSSSIQTIMKISRYRTNKLENDQLLPTKVGPCATPCDVLLETTSLVS